MCWVIRRMPMQQKPGSAERFSTLWVDSFANLAMRASVHKTLLVIHSPARVGNPAHVSLSLQSRRLPIDLKMTARMISCPRELLKVLPNGSGEQRKWTMGSQRGIDRPQLSRTFLTGARVISITGILRFPFCMRRLYWTTFENWPVLRATCRKLTLQTHLRSEEHTSELQSHVNLVC